MEHPTKADVNPINRLLVAIVISFAGVVGGILLHQLMVPAVIMSMALPVRTSVVALSDHFGVPSAPRRLTDLTLEEREAYDLLVAWEARFERSRTTLGSETVKSYVINWPGAHQYVQVDGESFSGVFVDGADVWRLNGSGGVATGGILSHGTEIGANLEILRASAQAPLFDLGVLLVGDTRMSDAFLFGKERSVKRDGKILRIRFDPPPETQLPGSIRIEVDWASGGLREWAILRIDGGQMVRSLESDQVSALGWTPTRVRSSMISPDGSVERQSVSSNVAEVRPLAAPPQMPRITAGTIIRDEATGLDVTWANKMRPLDLERARIVVGRAQEGLVVEGPPASSATCGLECLAYMLLLEGHDQKAPRVPELFHDASDGVTLLEIRDAARQLGLRAEGVRGGGESLLQLQLPAILSVRNAHFVVLVRIADGVYTLIDPPYSVRKWTADKMAKRWTGYALVVPR